ncbi:hypothetical protein Zm00014a_025627, partial [Zea mays]
NILDLIINCRYPNNLVDSLAIDRRHPNTLTNYPANYELHPFDYSLIH